MSKIAVAIPAYNAAQTIGQVISQVSEFIPTENIFVVDDGSDDQTESISCEKGTWVLRHAVRRGKGATLRDAITKIVEQDFDLVITIDSDLQHDPSEIPNFILASDSFDLVIGKRTISSDGMPFHRFLSNSITTAMISWRTGVRVEDSQCGYRLYRTDVLRKIDSRCLHYDYESDMLIKTALAGFRIGFVPIKTIYNDSRSSIRVIDILRFVRVYLKSFLPFSKSSSNSDHATKAFVENQPDLRFHDENRSS